MFMDIFVDSFDVHSPVKNGVKEVIDNVQARQRKQCVFLWSFKLKRVDKKN